MRQRTDTAGNQPMALAVDLSKPLEKGGGAELNYLKSTLTCGGLVTVNELDSRVAIVHRCFSERGDSILSVFS